MDANSQLIVDETLLAVGLVNNEIMAISEGSTDLYIR